MRKLKISVSAPLLVLIIFALTRLSLHIDASKLGYRDNIFLSAVVLQLMIFCIPGIFYCKLKPAGYMSKLKFEFFSPNKIYFSVTSLLVMLTGTALLRTVMFKFGIFTGTEPLYASYFSGGIYDAKSAVYVIIALAFIPAVCEEFIFRSILITEYKSCTKSTAASIIIPSLLFAMMHFSVSEFPIFLFSGLLLSFTAYVTGSVFACVLIHFANNLVSIFLESYILDFIGNVNNFIFFIFILTVLFLLFCAMLFGESENIYFNKGINGVKSEEETEKDEAASEDSNTVISAVSSPIFLLCILFFIASAAKII